MPSSQKGAEGQDAMKQSSETSPGTWINYVLRLFINQYVKINRKTKVVSVVPASSKYIPRHIPI